MRLDLGSDWIHYGAHGDSHHNSNTQPARPPVTVHKWRVGDLVMLAGEPVAIAGFIDHGGPGPLDEVLVELANGRAIGERARSISPAAGTPPLGSAGGYGGSGPAHLALAILLRATDRETAVAHYQAQVGRDREAAAGGLLPAPRQGARLACRESRMMECTTRSVRSTTGRGGERMRDAQIRTTAPSSRTSPTPMHVPACVRSSIGQFSGKHVSARPSSIQTLTQYGLSEG